MPAAATAATVIVPWNDADAVRRAVAEHEFAAILAEPYPANMGLVPAECGFLELLRECADANGALLVFDEVITGFRVAPRRRAGADRRPARPHRHGQGHRRRPARGGLRRLARADGARSRPAGDVYQAGTLSGNPLAVAAGLASLRMLDEEAYARLEATTRALGRGLEEAARRPAGAGRVRHGPA